jgi:hypothetical protein
MSDLKVRPLVLAQALESEAWRKGSREEERSEQDGTFSRINYHDAGGKKAGR